MSCSGGKAEDGQGTFQGVLTVLCERLAVCRLDPGDSMPSALAASRFWSVTRTDQELSVVLPEVNVPPGWQAERGWRCLAVQGPLDFRQVGVLASLSVPLAEAGISIFALSTYDTDYLLLRDADLECARVALARHGHVIREEMPAGGNV